MKMSDILNEDGRIVKGVNTTVDVDVDEIPRQAEKFGNKVDKDGRPPTLSKKVKGSSTNVLYNLGMAENSIFEALEEAWSKKYKRSINCNNPKGFSQKAHCAGRKKNEAASPQMDPKAVEFEMLRDAEKRRLAGEYKRIGPQLAITTWGAALAQAVANYLGGQYLSQLELTLAKQGLKLATENFADGKKKGKSRPGRVKKAGASCKGSVTSLRKKAKKYSGERGKMYHWCANMKGGKKK
jgi:hypothetical protein